MRRTCLLFVVCSITLALMAGASPAQDRSSGILFTGCPPALSGGHCDSMFYQVVAVDLSTGKQCPEMKYILVDGPGEINEKTGLWQFHPEKEDLPWRWRDSVEIAAHKGNDTTTSDENCRFPIAVTDRPPTLVGGSSQQFDVAVGDTLIIQLTPVDNDWCDVPFMDSVQIDSSSGLFIYDPLSRIVTFVPDSADAGKQFDVFTTVTSGVFTSHCTLRISVAAIMPSYIVRLGYKLDQIQGQYCDIPITLTEFDTQQGMSGFDFLVGYDASALLFQLAYEGDLYTECAWEYFTYRYGAEGNCDSTCPNGLLRIVGLAETNNGSLHPGCDYPGPGYVSSAPVTLAFLRFLVSNDRTLEGAFLPIRFFWTDCGDNMISNYTLNRLYISHDVFDGGELLISDTSLFPTYKGSQDECVTEDPNNNRYVLKVVDFYNGGIDIFGGGWVDEGGDINLNGIPYEIADAVMFSEYFTHGLTAFGAHIDGSVAASDVTKDGLTLTIADLIYLIRVIIGEAIPIDHDHLTPSPNIAAFSWDQSINRVVSFNSYDTLGAINLVAAGEFTPYLLAAQMEMKYAIDSGLTRILVWSLDGHAMTSGDILAIPGATEIVSIETATHDGRMVTTSLEIIDEPTPASYAVRIGSAHDYPPGSYLDIPITLLTFDSTQGLGGFDFLIGYDASDLAFQLASEGDLYDECAWEYFTYRYGMEGNCTNCPTGMLRILGLAETNNGDVHPGCAWNNVGYVASAPVALANLRFLISNDVQLGDTWVPIRFLWVDCGDNMLSNFDGSDALLSSGVFDLGEQDISGVEAFPTYKGAQDECVNENPTNGRSAVRGVDFINGGVGVYRPDSVGCDGDVNLNGLPFEVADAVIMTNYFHLVYEGPGSPETEMCIDVNDDGQNTIADLVFFGQVVKGNILPDPALPSPNPAAFVWDRATGVLSVSTYDTLGAVYMFVEGEVAPIALSGEHSVSTTSTGLTRILIFSGVGTTAIMFGPVEGIPGATGIVEIQASTHDGRAVTTSLEITALEEPTYAVRIGCEYDVMPGWEYSVPITLERINHNKGLSGFSFLIGYPKDALALMSVDAGGLIDSCEWEYFSYRNDANSECGEACPSGMLKILGLAEVGMDSIGPNPSCAVDNPGWVNSTPTTIATMQFKVDAGLRMDCNYMPIRFFWYDCGDNMLVSRDAHGFVSYDVYEDCSDVLRTHDNPLPSYTGAPSTCLPTGGGGNTVRAVDFYNGGLELLCVDSVAHRGDLNRNNVAFEVADAQMFANFFVAGLDAFGADAAQSVINSDIDEDGNDLEVQDFVCLSNVVTGRSAVDEYPSQVPSPNIAMFGIDPGYGTVWMATADTIGAVYLELSGQVEPGAVEGQPHVDLRVAGGVTKVLVWGLGTSFTEGPLVTIPGAVEILDIEIATVDARRVNVVLDPTSVGSDDEAVPSEFSLHGNYPNPFNPITTIAYDLPERADVTLIVYNVVGQKVCTLVDRFEAAGRHEVFWDGRDESGQTVSSGVYLYRITAGDFAQSRKMLLLK